jgi:hypothetical protein
MRQAQGAILPRKAERYAQVCSKLLELALKAKGDREPDRKVIIDRDRN